MPTRRFWFTAAAVAFMVATRPTALPDLASAGIPFGTAAIETLLDSGVLPCFQPPVVPIALQPGCQHITGSVDRDGLYLRGWQSQ